MCYTYQLDSDIVRIIFKNWHTMNKKEIVIKFSSIRDRAFKKYMDWFLVHQFTIDNTLKIASLETFEGFDYNNDNYGICLKIYQASSDNSIVDGIRIKELDKALKEWYASSNLKEFKEYFVGHRLIDMEDFITFYSKDEKSQECGYCHTTKKELDELIRVEKIFTRRLSTRGRSLEVDQIHPGKGYVKGNLILSCYWCNNAKTDEFSAEEFKPIGLEIGKSLRKRLK